MSYPSNKTRILLILLLLGGSSCSSESTNFQPQEGQQSWWEKQQEGQQAWWDWMTCQIHGNCNESTNPTGSPTVSPTFMTSMSPSYSPTTTTTTTSKTTAEEGWSHYNDPNTSSSSLLLMVLLPVLGIAWGIDASAMHQTIHSYLQPPYYFYKHTSSKCALILYGIGIVTLDALLFFLFGYSVLHLNHNNNNNSVWMCVGMVVLLFGRFCTRIHWVANHLVLEKLAKWLQWKEDQDVLALRSQDDDDADTVAVAQEDESVVGGGGWIPTILYNYPHHDYDDHNHDNNDNDDHNHDNSKNKKWYNHVGDKLKRIRTEMKLKAERVQNSTKQLYDVGLQEAIQETNDSHHTHTVRSNNDSKNDDGMIELKRRASSSGDYNVATFTITDNDNDHEEEEEQETSSNSYQSSQDTSSMTSQPETRQTGESKPGSSSSLLSRVLQWQGDVTFHIV
mmetsp:Transcript_45603/g.67228  ORF Transcript_45603/g.67228 Transcript_45603/m.67228 type:complete len:449 (+) Transcript_45603:169-1515(+)